MEVNVNELSGAALDWAVGTVVGAFKWGDDGEELEIHVYDRKSDGRRCFWTENHSCGYMPSEDWAQGGPLADRFKPDLQTWNNNQFAGVLHSDPDDPLPLIMCQGETYLIALCRVIVADRMGSVVNVPDELL